jgi:transposase
LDNKLTIDAAERIDGLAIHWHRASAVFAMRCNPLIRSFHQHLRAQGKPAKVALTACMRKLLVIMNAMPKHQSAWSPALDMQHSC